MSGIGGIGGGGGGDFKIPEPLQPPSQKLSGSEVGASRSRHEEIQHWINERDDCSTLKRQIIKEAMRLNGEGKLNKKAIENLTERWNNAQKKYSIAEQKLIALSLER